jgi:hypothetical protein
MTRIFHRSPPPKRGEIDFAAFTRWTAGVPACRQGHAISRAWAVEVRAKSKGD